MLFESAPLTFTTDGNELDWQPVTVAVSGLNLTAGQTYVFLLNANFDGNFGAGSARVGANRVGFDGTTSATRTAALSSCIETSAARLWILRRPHWFSFGTGDDLAYRLTYDDSNRAPTANDDDYSATQGTTLTVNADAGVLDNDTDPDGDLLTVTSFSGAGGTGNVGTTVSGAWGDLLLHADGSFSYTPSAAKLALAPAADTPVDSFDYTVSDGNGGTATATLEIAVTPTGIVWTGTNKGDIKTGTAGNDVLNGGNAGDQIDGGAGDDKIFGNNGNDLLFGGKGNDSSTAATASIR